MKRATLEIDGLKRAWQDAMAARDDHELAHCGRFDLTCADAARLGRAEIEAWQGYFIARYPEGATS